MNKKEKHFDHALFRDRLYEVSNEKNQKDIAEKISVNPATLSKWVNADATPSINDILNISRKYNCSVDYLLGVSSSDTRNKSLSTKEICKSLLTIIEHTHAEVVIDKTEADKADFDEADKKPLTLRSYLTISMLREETFFKDDYYSNWQKDLIFEFFRKYEGLQNLKRQAAIPQEYSDDLINSWLDRVEKREKDLSERTTNYKYHLHMRVLEEESIGKEDNNG